MNTEEIIYLDNAATTYPKPEAVYAEMDRVNRSLAFNAGRGSYALAKEADEIIAETREALLDLVHAKEEAEVVLSASATVAFNQIIGGMDWKESDVVYVSPYEHNAVVRPLDLWKERIGFTIIELPLEKESLKIDLEKMEYLFTEQPPTHIFLSQVSNVTGYILPIEEICKIAKKYDAITVIDASQSLGLTELDMQKVPADIVAFAGHKNLYGPFGTGGFFLRHGIKLKVFLAGGTGSDSLNPKMPLESPARYEAASPNIVAIAGLRAALMEIKAAGTANWLAHEQQLTDKLIAQLKRIPGVKLYGDFGQDKVGIVPFHIRGYQAAEVGMLLDTDYGIAVRTGYHCAPLIHKHLKDEASGGVVRVGIGRYTTEKEIDTLVAAVGELAE